VDPLSPADIERRRGRLRASVFLLLAAFATFSVVMSFLGSDILVMLHLAPSAARYGVLVLALGFVALVVERDRALRAMAAAGERHRILMTSLQNRLDVLESLLDAGDRLNSPLMVHDVLDVLLDAAINLTGAQGGSVGAIDQDAAEVTVARRHSMSVDPTALDLADLIDIPLLSDGRQVGLLQLALPFDTDDPVLREVLERFAERAASALERAQQMAKERASVAYLRAANIVKSRFLQTVSHELRTPLTSIIGYSRTLDHHWERLPDEMKVEFVRSINEQGGRLKMLVERILEAARVELEGVTVRRIVHDIRRSVERGLAGFIHDTARIAVALPGEPVTAEIDPFVVEQAVQNLVDNALRYTAGEVRVSLDHYRDRVVITVSDSGPGMGQSDLDLVVLPLGRIDENVNSGTGLGLHIVRTLVADHGGRLEIVSEPAGTRVQVSLPRAAPALAREVSLAGA
jgi:signal transduction histidine kinase